MILGLDWQKEVGAIIDPQNESIQIKNEIIQTKDTMSEENDIFMFKIEENKQEIEFSDDDYNIDTKYFKPPILVDQTPQIQNSFIDLCTMRIETLSEKTLVTPPYRRAIREHTEINVEIKKILKANIIRPSMSPWSVEVVMVRKQGKANRLCLNYKPLNAITIKDKFPIPRIYLIKWLDFPEKENEWLEAKAFNDKRTLDEYWSTQPKDLRKPISKRMNISNILFLLSILFQINQQILIIWFINSSFIHNLITKYSFIECNYI